MLRNTVSFSLVCVLTFAGPALADDDGAERLAKANSVFGEIMENREAGIPQDLLAKAHCVGVIPGLKKGGFIVGGQFGRGYILCRNGGGSAWTAPSAVLIEGGSFGLQIGGGEVDVVMLVMNEEGKRKLLESEFKLGGEAGVMAGPVGRTASAETDAYMHAEILSYSKSKGVFAGVALSGATLREDKEANEKLYDQPLTSQQILSGEVAPPEAAQPLIATLTQWSSQER